MSTRAWSTFNKTWTFSLRSRTANRSITWSWTLHSLQCLRELCKVVSTGLWKDVDVSWTPVLLADTGKSGKFNYWMRFTARVHKFSKNLRATSKFWEPKEWQVPNRNPKILVWLVTCEPPCYLAHFAWLLTQFLSKNQKMKPLSLQYYAGFEHPRFPST